MHWRHCVTMVGLIALASGMAAPARAADKVEAGAHGEASTAMKFTIGPPSAWVLPATIPAPPAAAHGASTISLLSDSQVRFTPEGSINFANSIYSIETAQGLDEGAIQVGWDPALEKLIVHHIRLIRAGQTIDLLGDGSKLPVMRREKNLEKATIDGRLTILVQPDDLRVGDIVDYSYTRTRLDPAMGGHSEIFIGPSDGASFGRSRIRLLWPSALQVKWRALPGVVQPTLHRVGGMSELTSDLVNLTTKEPPLGAPSRFRAINSVQLSDFPDWASVARNVEPLYTRAATLVPQSPLHGEIAHIAAVSSDPRVRAEMALALVQEKVRYLLIEMNGGGYQPATADLTWSRRYGDCKAKTVLLVAVLRGLGITARPVLVSTTAGDSVPEMLPSMGAFDHVLVEATIGGRSYWLDGTRLGDRRLAQIQTPGYRFGLPIVAADARLVALVPEPLSAPTEAVDLAIDASSGIDVPAPVKAEMRFRGNSAIDRRLEYLDLSAADRDEALRKFWRKNYDFITPISVATSDDPVTGDFVMTISGTAKMDWSGEAGTRWYEVDGARVGWKFDIVRDGQLNQDAPFAFDYPDWWAKRETIKLPYAGKGFQLQGGDVDESVGGLYAFHRSVKIEGEVLTMEANTRALMGELFAAKVATTRARMGELSGIGVFIRKPDDYVATDADLVALKGDRKALAAALLNRGAHRFDAGQADASLVDIDAALALDDSVANSHAIRAMLLASKHDPRAAVAADRAFAIDSKSWLALSAKGVVALLSKRNTEAEDFYSRSLAIEPKFVRSLAGRGSARMLLANNAGALADYDAALALDPSLAIRGQRAVTLMAAGRYEEAVADLDLALAKDKSNVDLRHLRALSFATAGKVTEALPLYDALIAEKPSVALYLERASLRADKAQAAADVDAAVRLDPKSVKPLLARASYAIDVRHYDRAEADLVAIERIDPGNRGATTLRVQLLSKIGKTTEALRLADGVVGKYKDALAYNERCWIKATLNIAFDTALADCNEGLKLSPNSPAILDSRAFVELRAGSLDAAIADYDAALKLYPKMAASLFGRGVARARKGDSADAAADLAAARYISPEIDARFAGYGMTLPTAAGAK